jgi:hypothetical protein
MGGGGWAGGRRLWRLRKWKNTFVAFSNIFLFKSLAYQTLFVFKMPEKLAFLDL